jgi:PKD repeat protein
MPRGFGPRGRCPFWASTRDRHRIRGTTLSGIVLAAVTLLILPGSVGPAPVFHGGADVPATGQSSHETVRSAAATLAVPSNVPIIPSPWNAPPTCANGTPANPFPVAFLPYGYETPNLFGLGSGSVGTDDLCYTGGPGGAVENSANFSNVGGAGGVLAYPHVEYGQDLWGGSPGAMAPGFTLPETDSRATNQSLWLTNTYAIQDRGGAAYDYVWDNFLSSYLPNPSNVSGPGNFSLEVMLWMTTGYEGSPWDSFTYGGSTPLPTLINTTFSEQPWDFSYFCQGTNNNELTVLYFYNGSGDAMNTTSRTFGVNFSTVLVNVNQMIHRDGESCWSYPANGDVGMFLDDLNLGSEFLTPWPSPYYGTAAFNWTISSMCFRFAQGIPTAGNVSCPAISGQPLAMNLQLSPDTGPVPLAVAFNASVSGGVPPYSYQWSFGDGSHSVVASPEHTFDQPGNYSVDVTVTDSNGTVVTGHATVESTSGGTGGPPPSPAGGPLGLSSTQWILVGGLGAASVILAGATILIRRRPKD